MRFHLPTKRTLTVVLSLSAIAAGGAEASAPSEYEQFLLELINRGRGDPLAEVDRYDDPNHWSGEPDLNEGLDPGTISSDPKQPLAWNVLLNDAAEDHSQWMLDQDVFSHTGAGGSDPGDRMAAAGYLFEPAPWGWGENLARWGSTRSDYDPVEIIEYQHAGLFGDHWAANRGHRTMLMHPRMREIGVGVVRGDYSNNGTVYDTIMITEDFAYTDDDPFVTGVVYRDLDGDGFYSPEAGESLPAVTVELLDPASGAVLASTATFASGGYAIKTLPGVYDVRFWGQGVIHRVDGVDVTDGFNVKIDAIDPAELFAGDANLDGLVSDADYTVWADNFGAAGGWGEGDFNGDGAVTDADYTLWADNFGAGALVPEPAGAVLLLSAVGAAGGLRRRCV
jgi:hypothetical protein